MIGQTFGRYEILESLGAGGMGEVYRARDTTLERDVAIKLLPEDFSDDPDRLARLEREAKLLAALNHPHIATIHGLEEASGRRFLVLELIEGESLQRRLSRGPLPIEEALETCGQIAEALEAAHAEGIIHRDLKPANVMMTGKGRTKVLDFGLGKSFGAAAAAADLTQSPTAALPATAAGVVLGTAPYMSPEQARGQPVDKRADIWGFGCLLFESLSGTPCFERATVADTLAAILESEPDWEALPATTPATVRSLVQRCLRRDRRRRLHDIADARIEIEDAVGPLNAGPAAAAAIAPAPTSATWRAVLPWAIAAGSLAVAVGLWAFATGSSSGPAEPAPIVFDVEVPEGLFPAPCCGRQLDVSPDGRLLTFAAVEEGTSRLYLRRLDATAITVLPGTEGARSPSFAPDGQSLAFTTGTTIQRVAVSGSAPLQVCDCVASTVTWAEPEWINFNGPDGLARIRADGGAIESVSSLAAGSVVSADPLPDGHGMLVYGPGGTFGAVSGAGDYTAFEDSGSGPRYLPTGHIIYARGSSLFAAPFDLDGRRMVGSPTRVLESVAADTIGSPQLGFSHTGTMAYLSVGGATAARTLVWVDAEGNAEPAFPDRRPFNNPALSPDGKRVAVEVANGAGFGIDIWVIDLEQQTSTPLTTSGSNIYPLWTPDQRRITYSSDVGSAGGFDGFWKLADGSGAPEAILTDTSTVHPSAWTAEGRLLYRHNRLEDRSLFVTTLAEGAVPAEIAASESDEYGLALSPDGEWVAYVSDLTGDPEVYVKALDSAGRGERISREGGTEPVWSRDGRQLFYRQSNWMIAASIETTPELVVGSRRPLFEWRDDTSGGWRARYDVGADGRFLMAALDEETAAAARRITVVVNWFEQLERLVPARR